MDGEDEGEGHDGQQTSQTHDQTPEPDDSHHIHSVVAFTLQHRSHYHYHAPPFRFGFIQPLALM